MHPSTDVNKRGVTVRAAQRLIYRAPSNNVLYRRSRYMYLRYLTEPRLQNWDGMEQNRVQVRDERHCCQQYDYNDDSNLRSTRSFGRGVTCSLQT